MLDSRPLGTFPEYTGTSADKASSLVDEIDEDALLFTHVSSRTVLVPRVQSMQEYILKHHKRMVLSALNQQIRSGMLSWIVCLWIPSVTYRTSWSNQAASSCVCQASIHSLSSRKISEEHASRWRAPLLWLSCFFAAAALKSMGLWGQNAPRRGVVMDRHIRYHKATRCGAPGQSIRKPYPAILAWIPAKIHAF